MPNKPSAKKRVRQTERRTATNKSRKTKMRSAIRVVEQAVKAGDKEAASAALKAAEPAIMRAAGKGVIHKNTGARKVSRLAASVKRLSS
jgi:small subunit ribosomal protein S20